MLKRVAGRSSAPSGPSPDGELTVDSWPLTVVREPAPFLFRFFRTVNCQRSTVNGSWLMRPRQIFLRLHLDQAAPRALELEAEL
jgi:hypothetical protein